MSSSPSTLSFNQVKNTQVFNFPSLPLLSRSSLSVPSVRCLFLIFPQISGSSNASTSAYLLHVEDCNQILIQGSIYSDQNDRTEEIEGKLFDDKDIISNLSSAGSSLPLAVGLCISYYIFYYFLCTLLLLLITTTRFSSFFFPSHHHCFVDILRGHFFDHPRYLQLSSSYSK